MAVQLSTSSFWTNVAVIGPTGNGKSTLAGFLLFAHWFIPPGEMEEADRAAQTRGDPSLKFAFLFDRKSSERVSTGSGHGGTQEISWRRLERPKRRYMLIDTPGHPRRVMYVVGALTDADIALLVVDPSVCLESRRAGQEAQRTDASATLAQIATQLALARFYGITQLIIALHKMDTHEFLEVDYRKAKAYLGRIVKKLGWMEDQVHFVPTAVEAVEEKGHNIITDAGPSLSSWYANGTLVQALEQVQPKPAPGDAPVRMQISHVSHGQQGFHWGISGKLFTGIVREQDELIIQPAGLQFRVDAIRPIDYTRYLDASHHSQSSAIAGELVNLSCMVTASGDDEAKLSIGEIASAVDFPCQVSSRLKAELVFFPVPSPSKQFLENFSGTFGMGHFHTRFRIKSFSLDGGGTWQSIENGGRKERTQKRRLLAKSIRAGKDTPILVELILDKQAPLERYVEDVNLGRFVLLDADHFICGGYITQVL
jgi:elongation factor 1 alpha-like protein